MFMRCLYDTC